MTATTLNRYHRAERTALVIGAGSAVAAVLLGWLGSGEWIPAWRLAAFACLQPALGSVLFVLIHRLTGGQWANGLAPFLLSGARLLPWAWLLVLPLLFQPISPPPEVQHRADETAPADDPHRAPPAGVGSAPVAEARAPAADPALVRGFRPRESHETGTWLQWYFSRPVLTGRAVLYALFFVLLASGSRRAFRSTQSMRWFGPLGLIASVFLLHLLATDWFVRLEPGWYSTGFPLVWICSQAAAGLALAVAAGSALDTDAENAAPGDRRRRLDWGNLLLATIMVWAYVAFVQLLIIWSGNLPAETAWYRHRAYGAWRWISIAVAGIAFAGPFSLLLSRAAKTRRVLLRGIALLILAGQFGYTAWLIVPAFPDAARHAPWLLAATSLAALALGLNRYLAGARVAAAELSA